MYSMMSCKQVCKVMLDLVCYILWTNLSTGVLCQSFSPPTGEICPGDDVTFTCVADIATLWTVTPAGDNGLCIYASSSRLPDMCGPGGRFTSSQTDVNGDTNNSSLSVDSITVDLNETLVECHDLAGDLIGSNDICIVGKVTSLSSKWSSDDNDIYT